MRLEGQSVELSSEHELSGEGCAFEAVPEFTNCEARRVALAYGERGINSQRPAPLVRGVSVVWFAAARGERERVVSNSKKELERDIA